MQRSILVAVLAGLPFFALAIIALWRQPTMSKLSHGALSVVTALVFGVAGIVVSYGYSTYWGLAVFAAAVASLVCGPAVRALRRIRSSERDQFALALCLVYACVAAIVGWVATTDLRYVEHLRTFEPSWPQVSMPSNAHLPLDSAFVHRRSWKVDGLNCQEVRAVVAEWWGSPVSHTHGAICFGVGANGSDRVGVQRLPNGVAVVTLYSRRSLL